MGKRERGFDRHGDRDRDRDRERERAVVNRSNACRSAGERDRDCRRGREGRTFTGSFVSFFFFCKRKGTGDRERRDGMGSTAAGERERDRRPGESFTN